MNLNVKLTLWDIKSKLIMMFTCIVGVGPDIDSLFECPVIHLSFDDKIWEGCK